MKKRFNVFVSVLMTLAFAAVIVAAATYSPESDSENKIIQPEGSLNKTSGQAGDTLSFAFTSEASVNTVELKEVGGAITRFEISTFEGETVYVSDYVGEYRYCSFPAVTTKGLNLKITEADDDFEIESMQAKYVYRTVSDDFKVTAYVTADSACKLDDSWKENAETITQFNVIGCLYFDIDGNIVFDGYDEAGFEDGKQVFEKALSNLKKLSPEAEIVATILGNRDLTGDGITESEDRYNVVIGNENRAAFITEVVDFVNEYDLDGVSFDYEYPYTPLSYKNYNAFLQELKQALGDKQLSAALSIWNIGLLKILPETLEILDRVELMSYDSFDERGNHSTFLTAYSDVTNAIQRGADAKTLNLGLPYYSRPVNKDAYWGSYKDVADKLGYGDNLITETYSVDGTTYITQPNYYNGIQMIYDKTCYALDSGLGGVMIWHFACDSTDPGLSLTAAIQRAIDSRS